jgi:hypothetical protein
MNYNEITGKKLPETIDLNASHCEEYLKAKKRMLFDLNKTFVLILI